MMRLIISLVALIVSGAFAAIRIANSRTLASMLAAGSRRVTMVTQRIKDDARLDSSETLNRIDLEDSVHVLREIEDHRDVAALARETGTSAPGQHRCAVPPAHGNSRDHIVGISRHDEPDRNLSVVRAIGRVQRAAAAVEAHLAADGTLQRMFEVGRFRKGINWFAM